MTSFNKLDNFLANIIRKGKINKKKCKCGCGDKIITCKICGFKSGYRHRNNHVCVKEKE